MTYDIVARFSQVTSLLVFVALFVGVVVYALWPSNRQRFDEIQRQSLDLGAGPGAGKKERGEKS